MKSTTKQIVIFLAIILAGGMIGFGVGHQVGSNSMYSCIKDYHRSNDRTRDINYEHYCDSIWITNPDYYLDVLVESDEFQEYIDKHGQWWDN